MNKVYLIFIILVILSLLIITTKKTLEYFSETQLQFIHIPKNAGTSIENLGNKYGIKWGRFIKKEDYQLYDTPCDYFYWHSPYFIKNKDLKYFAVLRNPYDKIISEFYYVDGFKQFPKNTHLENFYSWLDNKYKIIQKDKYWNNCHMLPQSEYVYDKNGEEKIDHLVYMDKQFKTNLDKLFKQYNLGINIDDFEKNNSIDKTFKKT
jgi:hypothetical protein